MTGYGKGECTLSGGTKAVVEIRCINSKNADINIKSQLVPKDKDLQIRKMLTEQLIRGTIDLSLNLELGENSEGKKINAAAFKSYMSQLQKLTGAKSGTEKILLAQSVLRLPEVMDSKSSEFSPADWKKIDKALQTAVNKVQTYRDEEGKALYKDITKRAATITKLLEQVKTADVKRVPQIKKRLCAKIEQSGYAVNPERLEQELIFYIEKLDINEEKVRLAQHCEYFMQTIDNEPYPGKKIGFIVQEMGREINTMGSKANDAKIQALVVKMKDELEKIREQALNVL